MARTYRIHPAIGIARVGNSRDRYFIGPESPGMLPSLDEPGSADGNGRYRDDGGSIKRQGARFRIYEYERSAAGDLTALREITADEAQITWHVHLANRKAFGQIITDLSEPRNKLIRDARERRERLIIDAGTQAIENSDRGPIELDQGTFQARAADKVPVSLGTLRTDERGRLLVLGGTGEALSPTGRRIHSTFNNDDWCDTTSDGPVTATLRLAGSSEERAIEEPAWVIVGPPDFAPPIGNVISLYDVVYDVAAEIDKRYAVTQDSPVSFTHDIYPILYHVCQMRWVTLSVSSVRQGHQPGQGGFFLDPGLFARLSSNEPGAASLRQAIFDRLRSPDGGGGDMPQLMEGDIPARLTTQQYARMRRWAEGTFAPDWPAGRPPSQPPDPVPLEQLPLELQPSALDRAGLDTCTGAAFFPGIEAPRTIMQRVTYASPFRVRLDPGPDPEFGPGKLTEELALPWQTDFIACGQNWWPAQRPNDVLRGSALPPEPWDAGVGGGQDMVEKWFRLGFVKKDPAADRYVEDERTL